jgi:two-component system, NarL family, invasion response regulator UvrY
MQPTAHRARTPGQPALTARELAFVRLVCSDLTYQQIAHVLKVSPRTVDGYREDLFEKIGVRSGVTLALWAVRVGVVEL